MRFVDVPHMARWIEHTGPQAIISGMIDAMELDFARWHSFELAPRVPSHSELGVIELMPTSDGRTFSLKHVNGHPSNPSRGYQTVVAFGVLSDVDTGYPRLLTEMTLLTALRTAAASGMVARLLAPADSRRLGMIGAGSQSEFQALAAMAVRPIEQIRVFDVDRAASEKLAANLATRGIEVRIAPSAAQAVADADIITTCTADKRNATVLRRADVREGAHINAIGGDCPGKTELDPAILDMGPVFVEYTPQTRIEGEIQVKPADYPVTELWEVVTGTRPGRTSEDQTTIFDSVGFAVEDFSALTYLDRCLTAPGGECFWTGIDLLAAPDDPKDLFGMLRGDAGRSAPDAVPSRVEGGCWDIEELIPSL